MLLHFLFALLSPLHSAPSFLIHGTDFCIANDETWVVDNIWKHSLDILSRMGNDPKNIKDFFLSQLKIASDLSLSIEERQDKLKYTWQEKRRTHAEKEEILSHLKPNLFLALVKVIKGYCLCFQLDLTEAADSFYSILFDKDFIQADRETKRQLIIRTIRQFAESNQ